MWDLRIYNPFGRLSTRKIFARAATLFVALFAYILLFAPNAYAADATFNGGNITYEGETYNGPITSKPDGTDAIPDNAQIYRANSGNNGDVAKFLYFPEGSDPAQANQANFIQYNYDADSLDYSNPSGQQSVAISASDNAAANTNGGDPNAPDGQETRCNVSGVGWLVCPISNFIAGGIDSAYDMVKNFVEVEPLSFSQTGSLYPAWDVMRGFANVAFVIAFLVVIYSQLTNIGLTNYGIKQIVPRLIVAAILVNVSYYICAIAIDLANITGTSIQDILMGLRERVFQVTDESPVSNISWGDIVTFTLSGGAAGAVGILAGINATGGTIAAASYALLPILAGAVLIIFVVLLVLAARQAIITMLVILAPLAFVAYILPGTEKWFKRWMDLFTSMMVFFPFFSLLFGGAQFAGSMIVMNANSLFMVMFGFAVQIAPLAALPLIIKFGSTLVSRIAGIVDNPRRGLVDRARNFSGAKQEMHRNRGISGDLKRRNAFRRAARGMAMSQRDTQRKTDMYKQQFEGYAAKKNATSKNRQRVEVELELAKLNTDRWQNETKRAVNELRAGNISGLATLQAQGDGSRSTDRADSLRKLYGRDDYASFTQDAVQRAQYADTENRISQQANSTAELEQRKNFSTQLIDSDDVRNRAGGIASDGAERALSAAIAQERGDYESRVKEKLQLFKHLNVSAAQKQALALGIDSSGNAVDYVEADYEGRTYRFDTNDVYTREAAIMNKLKTGSFGEIEQIIKESGKQVQVFDKNNNLSAPRKGHAYEFSTTVADEIADLKLQGKAIYFGSKTIDEVAQGQVSGDLGLDKAALRIVHTGKINPEALSSMNADAIQRFNTLVKDIGNRANTNEYYINNFTTAGGLSSADAAQNRQTYRTNVNTLRQSAHEVLNTDILRKNADANSIKALEDLIS